MKLNTAIVHDLRMCMKITTVLKTSREIIQWRYLFVQDRLSLVIWLKFLVIC